MLDAATMTRIMNDIRGEVPPGWSSLTYTEEMLAWRAEVAREWAALTSTQPGPTLEVPTELPA